SVDEAVAVFPMDCKAYRHPVRDSLVEHLEPLMDAVLVEQLCLRDQEVEGLEVRLLSSTHALPMPCLGARLQIIVERCWLHGCPPDHRSALGWWVSRGSPVRKSCHRNQKCHWLSSRANPFWTRPPPAQSGLLLSPLAAW